MVNLFANNVKLRLSKDIVNLCTNNVKIWLSKDWLIHMPIILNLGLS